ncbi:MAG: GTP cyclohydrolase I FolE [Oscillospiraceae bacterium]|nr:GTP cyclohydrolase I FolE [Oscillospiraceae bacterium]
MSLDKDKIEKAILMILEAIGEDPNREGLIDTPKRISKMYEEIFVGMKMKGKDVLGTTFSIDNDNIVIEKDIEFYSMCEHHMLPFFGKIHIAYIPNKRVVGLSKLVRLCEVHARRLQLQEKLTNDIAKDLYSGLNAKGVIVQIEAIHLCMSMRGVQKCYAKTTTLAALGILKEDKIQREEALKLING